MKFVCRLMGGQYAPPTEPDTALRASGCFLALLTLVICLLETHAHAHSYCLRRRGWFEADAKVEAALESAERRICKTAAHKFKKSFKRIPFEPVLQTAGYYFDQRSQKVILGVGLQAPLPDSARSPWSSQLFDDGVSTWSEATHTEFIPPAMYAKSTFCSVDPHAPIRTITIDPPESWRDMRCLAQEGTGSDDGVEIGLVCRNSYEKRQVECQWKGSRAWKLTVDYERLRDDSLAYVGSLSAPARGWRRWFGGRDQYNLNCRPLP